MRFALIPLLLAAGLPMGSLAAPPMTLAGSSGTFRVHVTTLKEARFKKTIRQQYDFSCGSAAVATLLTYQYGYPVSEQTTFEQMYAHGDQAKISREGFSLLDIKRYLEANGFQADGFQVSLDKLKQENLPAIVLIDEHGYHHFVVVKGLRNDRVLIGDPALGTRAMSRERFQGLWKNALVFVIHNRRDLATFNDPGDWRVAPPAPLSTAIDRNGLDRIVMPKRGPGDI